MLKKINIWQQYDGKQNKPKVVRVIYFYMHFIFLLSFLVKSRPAVPHFSFVSPTFSPLLLLFLSPTFSPLLLENFRKKLVLKSSA